MGLIIKVDESRLDEMAQIGVLDDRYIVRIWTNDPGFIPHIHITDKSTGGKLLDACVRLDKSAYFKHGCHTDSLNANQRKALDAFMRKELENDYFPNNYEYAVYEWNRNNSSTLIEPDKGADGKIICQLFIAFTLKRAAGPIIL